MNQQILEVDISCNDNFIKVQKTKYTELKYILKKLATDADKSFRIGEKGFWKKYLNSVSIVNHGLGFIFSDVTE